MKLYDVKRGQKYKLVEPDINRLHPDFRDVVFTLETLDGMYSRSTADRPGLGPYQFSVMTEVEVVEDSNVG